MTTNLGGFFDQADAAVAPPAPPQPVGSNGLAAGSATDSQVAPNPVAGLFDEVDKLHASRTLQAAQAVTAGNASQSSQNAAQAAKLAPQVGLPQGVVETDVPRFQQQADQQRNATILAQSPVLAQWVAANPDSARVAQDEYDKLSLLEKTWDGTKFVYGQVASALGQLTKPAYLALAAPAAVWEYATGDSRWADWQLEHTVGRLDRYTEAQQLPTNAGFAKRATAYAANMAAMLGAAMGTGGESALPAAASGLDALWAAGASATRGMALPSLSSAVDTGQHVLEQTDDAGAAARAALASYALTTAQGLIPMSAPGGLASRILTGGASGVVTGEAQRRAMNAILPASMQQAYDPDQVLFNAITGGVLGGVLGPRREPEMHAAVRQTYADAMQTEMAVDAAQRISVLGKVAGESQLRSANPTAFQEFVRSVTDGSPLEAVFVNGDKLQAAYAQSNTAPSTDLASRIHEAVLTGGDVRIPIDEYANAIAGNPVEKAALPEMRAQPDGPTFSEAQQLYQNAQEVMTSRAALLAQARQQRVAFDEDKASVHQQVLDQLAATGRNTDAVNRAYATLVSEFYGAQAQREGTTPSALFAKHPLRVAADDAGGERLAQHGPERDVGSTLMELGKHEALFQYPKSSAKDLETIAKDKDPHLKVEADTITQMDGTEKPTGRYTVTLPNGRKGSLEEKDGKVWINAARVGEGKGGSLLYDLAANYARSNGLKFIGDPDGLSDAGMRRRLENMISSAVKYGTTEHLEPHDRQRIGETKLGLPPLKWEDGAHADNIESMVRASAATNEHNQPAGTGLDFDPRTGEFRDREGNLVGDAPGAFDLLSQLERGTSGAGAGGRATLQRAALFRSLLRGADERRGLLERLRGEQGGAGAGAGGLEGSFYQGVGRDGALAQNERGTYSPASRTISVLANADLSTFLHESGHFFLDSLERIAAGGGSEGARADMDTLLKHYGVEGATPDERLAAWLGKTVDDKRDAHEKFAESFERYLMEGKAPSPELQTLFSRFRAWLLNVYKTLRGAPIDPEVRAVMDRMLATDKAIHEAEAQRRYAPLFENAKAAGMSTDEFNAYLAAGQHATDTAVSELQARSMKDMKWLSTAKGKAMRALQREADAAREQVRAQVENEVSAHPAFEAQEFMRQHAGQSEEFKAATKDWTERRAKVEDETRRAVKDEVWQASAEAAAGQKGLQKGQFLARNKRAIDAEVERRLADWERTSGRPRPEDRSDLDFVAAMHGFESEGAMRQAISDAGDKADVIRAMTDQRMLQEHGELVDPQTVEDAANAAVHNEARARFMATGLKALTKSPLPAAELARAAKAAADGIVAGKRVGDLRPDRYLAAEARANAGAIAAAAKNPAGAIESQRAALLNNRLAKAARDAQDEVSKGLDYLRKFDKPSTAQAVGADYMDRINELTSNYDLSQRMVSQKSVGNRAGFRQWLDSEFQRTGVMPQVPEALLDFAARVHWKEMSVEQFRGLLDAVKSLEHVGREQTQVMVNGQRVALDDLVRRALEQTASLPHAEPVDVQPHLAHARGLDRINASWLSLKSKVRSMDAALLKIEQVFQWLTHGGRSGLGDLEKSGPYLEMFQRAANAEGEERAMRADSTKDLRDLKGLLSGVDIHEEISVPELPRQGRGTKWYREELISAALNTGNAENLRKLAEGYGWNPDVVEHVLDRHLSAAEWKFVQGAWGAVGKYGEQIKQLERRQTGATPDMVQPRRITNSHGEFEGGYYPLVYDAFQDRKISEKYERNADTLFENQWARPTTSQGHTVQRTGYVGPLHLSLGVISRHLDQVTHDLAWREAIVDMNKFLSHPEIQRDVDQVLGREYTKQFRPWLQAMANDKVFNSAGDSAWERFYRKARSNASMVGLGFRLSTMEIHGLSALSNSIGEVGSTWFAKGASAFMKDWAGTKQFMYDRSPEMAHRFDEMDRNVHEAIDQINERARSFGPISTTRRAVDGARRFAFYGVAALDMGSAAPTWMAAYLKGMSPESKGGLGLSEEAAVDAANRAVRNAHGGGGAKDLAAVQRSKGVMSMATMFYSYWNHMYNRQRDLFKGYANLPDSFKQGTGTKDFAKLLARSWWYFVVPQLIHAALKPTPANDQDDEATHMAKEVALGFVSGVPILRDLASAAINGRDYTITPLEAAGKAIVKATDDAVKVAQGQPAPQHMGKDVAQAAGYAVGLPTGQLSQTGSFLWDVYDGDVDPHSLAEWYRGLTTGKTEK